MTDTTQPRPQGLLLVDFKMAARREKISILRPAILKSNVELRSCKTRKWAYCDLWKFFISTQETVEKKAGVTHLRYKVLTSSNKDETAVCPLSVGILLYRFLLCSCLETFFT